jgi:hypothetical protein
VSHYTVTVVLAETPRTHPGGNLDMAHIEEMVSAALEPFDENIEVEPYKSYTDPVPENWRSMPTRELGWPYSSLREEDPEVDLGDPAAVAALANAKWGDDEKYFVDEKGLYQMSNYNPQSKWDWWVIGGRWDGFYTKTDGFKANVARKGDIVTEDERVQTYAVLAEGVWKAPGRMGWFGMSTEGETEQDAFSKWFDQFWTGLNDDAFVAVVDVHI